MEVQRRIPLMGCLAVALLGFVEVAECADNLIFVPLTPCRVIDTRVAGAGGPLVAGTPRSFFFRGPTRNYQSPPNQGGNTGGCGIPDLTSDGGASEENLAKAVAINIIAVAPAGAGNFRAWPANQAVPLASVVNYAAISGLNLANGVIVPMCDEAAASPCASGDVTFQADTSGAHLVVDVVGYFHAGSRATTLSNTALGHLALQASTGGLSIDNTASGYGALGANTIGRRNTAHGSGALRSNTTGSYNTASGASALENNTADFNTAAGQLALVNNTSGSNNAAGGASALYSNLSGSKNTAFGAKALFSTTTGVRNVGIGYGAGSALTAGSENIFISSAGESADSATIRIGTSGIQEKAFIAGIRGVTTANANAIAVLIDSAGQLGTVSSSLRVKQDIEDVGAASARVLSLRPVKFRYKEHAARGDETPQFGLIAEEVAEVFPELVVYDREGKPETVKYHLLVPLLLGEAQRQESELTRQREEIRLQKAELADQRRLIQELLRRTDPTKSAGGRH